MGIDLITPKVTSNDVELKILRWHLDDGDFVAEGVDLIDFSTSKAAVIFASEGAGFLRKFKHTGDVAHIGELFARLYPTREQALAAKVETQRTTSAPGDIRLSQAAARFAEANHINTAQWSGPKLTTLRDLRGDVRPNSLTTVDATYVSGLTVQLSGESFYNNALPRIIFETARMLKDFPLIAPLGPIGAAVDTGHGLKVAALADAEKLTVEKIKEFLMEFALRDMRNELRVDDLKATVFTITDLSQENILNFSPLINGQQNAILGIGGDRELPGQPISLTLRFDHRAVSGREAGRFLNSLKARLRDTRE